MEKVRSLKQKNKILQNSVLVQYKVIKTVNNLIKKNSLIIHLVLNLKDFKKIFLNAKREIKSLVYQ